MPDHTRRNIYAWAFYDWANSAFATTVMAGFFPIFFKQYWSADSGATVTTFRLGMANSGASLVVVLLSPLLGAIADRGSARKRFLFFFTFLGVLNTALLYLVGQGDWMPAVLLYVLAVVGFSGGVTFYDALIISVSKRSRLDQVSALGFALGYLGGGLLFALNTLMVLKPALFGLADAAQAIRVSFLTVAAWWALFSIPVFLFVPEPESRAAAPGLRAIRAGLAELANTLRHVRTLRTVAFFLAGYFLYIDGVDTVIRMAVDYGMSLGFDPDSLIVALLITQAVGFPAALVFGRIGERYGPKTGIYIAIAVYVAVVIYAYFMQQVSEFYVLAVVIGLVQGGIQSLSRSLYARIIPPGKAAEFFGLYNMWGKFSVVLGPALMGGVGLLTGSPRASILSVIVLFIAGAALLGAVDIAQGERRAAELEGT